MKEKLFLFLLLLCIFQVAPAFSEEIASKLNTQKDLYKPIILDNNIENRLIASAENKLDEEVNDNAVSFPQNPKTYETLSEDTPNDQGTSTTPIAPDQNTASSPTIDQNAPSTASTDGDKTYTDADETNWAYKSVMELSNKYKVLEGYPDGTFKGNKAPTRYEMAQLIARLAAKVEEDQIKLSSLDHAAIKGLKAEFEKEILTLAARIEKNETKIAEVSEKHEKDISAINSNVDELKGRYFFSPELRFRYAFGEYNTPPDGAYANTRLRLTSNTKAFKDTFIITRLQVETANILKMSENFDETPDAKLTLGYVKTGDITSWVPKKFGKFDIYGGIMPQNWLFVINGYTTNVDQRGFSDANGAFSVYGDQFSAIGREGTNGRRINIGGEYSKAFSKYNGLLKVSCLRAGGGSLDNTNRADTISSGRESTFFSAMAQMDIPIHKKPVELKVNHFYSHDDNGIARNTWSVGGRLSTKFNKVGVFKVAGMGYGGTVPPRMINGVGGKGFTLQFAYNPTIKAFGKFFGDPDKITHKTPCYVPGKTEVGVSFSHFKNGADVTLNAYDLTISRYFTSTIFGRVTFSRANPSWHGPGLATKDSILLETIFKI